MTDYWSLNNNEHILLHYTLHTYILFFIYICWYLLQSLFSGLLVINVFYDLVNNLSRPLVILVLHDPLNDILCTQTTVRPVKHISWDTWCTDFSWLHSEGKISKMIFSFHNRTVHASRIWFNCSYYCAEAERIVN